MKKKPIIIVSLIIIFIASISLSFYLGTKQKESSSSNPPETKEDDFSNILSDIMGEWGTCTENGCLGIIISEDETEKYTYTPYTMWSEFGTTGTITKTIKKEAGVYELTVYFPAYESVEITSPEETVTITLDISQRENNILLVNDIQYELITGDREEFFLAKVTNQ